MYIIIILSYNLRLKSRQMVSSMIPPASPSLPRSRRECGSRLKSMKALGLYRSRSCRFEDLPGPILCSLERIPRHIRLGYARSTCNGDLPLPGRPATVMKTPTGLWTSDSSCCSWNLTRAMKTRPDQRQEGGQQGTFLALLGLLGQFQRLVLLVHT